MRMQIHDGKRQLVNRRLRQAAHLFLGSALFFLAACSDSTGSDAGNSLTVTPGASLRVEVKGPGRLSFTVKGIDMDPDKDSQPIVYFYDSKGFGGGRSTGGFQGDLRNYKLKVFDVNGDLMGDEFERYGYEWNSGDSVAVTIEWNASSITARVGGAVAVKTGAIPSNFTIGVGYPPTARDGWDGAVYTDIDWP